MKDLSIKKFIFTCIVVLFTLSFHSCDDAIEFGQVDEEVLGKVGATYASLQNAHDARPLRVIEVFKKENGKATINVELNKYAAALLNLQVKPNAALVEQYNKKNGTDFQMYPMENVKIENEGEVVVVPGDKKSNCIKIEFISKGEEGKSYLFPLSIQQPSTTDVKLKDESYIFVVTDKGNKPSAAKSSGIVTNFYLGLLEPNNPLNIGEWSLKYSKKPFADIICLFAANINYDKASGRVEFRMNEHLTPLLEYRERYLKPLQDRGIKITLSILGNWDAAGLANLAPETAKDFARELKAIIDAYELDGIEFDDEYTDYGQADGIPGFVNPSSEAFARLCYEVKRIMPDKLCCVYVYGYAYRGFPEYTEGVKTAHFIDYAYEPMYGGLVPDIQDRFSGMVKKQVGPYSRHLGEQGGYGTMNDDDMRIVRNEYGANMFFDYRDERRESYIGLFNRMTNILYDEDVVCTGIKHSTEGL